MKEEDYIRTKKGLIGKIYSFASNMEYDYVVLKSGVLVDKNKIIKSSPNLIDLIEVGDYVNGGMVDLINDKYIGIENQEGYIIKKGFKIERIVTKEQFESMEYKIC